MAPTNETHPQWKDLAEMWSAAQAEHAYVPGYELTAFVLPEDPARGWEGEIGWEVFGGPELTDEVATGQARSFDEAKMRAEAAWRALLRGPSST